MRVQALHAAIAENRLGLPSGGLTRADKELLRRRIVALAEEFEVWLLRPVDPDAPAGDGPAS